MLCRHFFFLPLLAGKPRTIPLEPEVADLAAFRLDCLKHFRYFIPRRERVDYASLVDSPASPTRLTRAFRYLEKVYDFDSKTYLEYRESINARKEGIR